MVQIHAINGFMWKPGKKLSITEEERKTLSAWVAAKTSPQRTVLRARICLLAAEILPNRAIAKALKTSRPTVGIGGRCPPWPEFPRPARRKGQGHCGGDAAHDPAGCDSLVYANDG